MYVSSQHTTLESSPSGRPQFFCDRTFRIQGVLFLACLDTLVLSDGASVYGPRKYKAGLYQILGVAFATVCEDRVKISLAIRLSEAIPGPSEFFLDFLFQYDTTTRWIQQMS